MLARSNGGFTTCLVAHIHANGMTIIANAGHLAPYINGREVSLENGLQLGIHASSTYPESEFSIPYGASVTLMTDGVVEAQNYAGELFGFERTVAISTGTAEEIANAAHAFGQEDDITVLTVTRRPLPTGDAAQLQVQALSPQLD